ncbi:MAG TPA: hypothetical protein VGE63_03685 [Candidatus Paceibacterota bacterium]
MFIFSLLYLLYVIAVIIMGFSTIVVIGASLPRNGEDLGKLYIEFLYDCLTFKFFRKN